MTNRYQIEITIQIEAPSTEYVLTKYLPKEYPGLPDCVQVTVFELEDEED